MICTPCPAPGRSVCRVIRRFLSYLALVVSGRGSVGGLGGRWGDVEADEGEGAVFGSCDLEGMGAVPCTLCHSVG